MSAPRNAQWGRIGREMRRLRERSGLTQDQLGKRVALSYGTISGIERGIRGTKPEYLAQIDHALSTGGVLLGMWKAIRDSHGLASFYRDTAETEQQSRVIQICQPLLVPGLLQTEEYMRAVISRERQTAETQAQVEDRVKARIARQALMEGEDPPLLQVVIDEPVLRRPVGGAAIMAAQLQHLLNVSDRPRVVVQVLPMSIGYHPGLDGAFHLHTTQDGREVLYMETRVSGGLIEDLDTVDLYKRFWGEVRGQALHLEASRELIAQVRREFS